VTNVLITGAGGQDAYYLMKKMSAIGYQTYGIVRHGDPGRYLYLEGVPFLTLVQADLLDYPSLMSIATGIPQPDFIINTAGLTSPAACWGTPELAGMVNGMGALRLMEIYSNPEIRFIQFSTIARFGPYGASKIWAEKMLEDYAVRGFPVTILRFAGHHSPRRSPVFLSRRVTKAIARIKNGEQEKLHLGDLNRQQDWGSADDFMDAVLEAMNADPGTFTVATGEPFSQREFVSRAFAAADMDWLEHVKENSFDYQPTDVQLLSEQPDANLNWRHQVGFDELIQWLVDSELAGQHG